VEVVAEVMDQEFEKFFLIGVGILFVLWPFSDDGSKK